MFRFCTTEIKGVYIIEPQLFGDNRGYFFDNSGDGFRYIAEINEGKWTLYSSLLPQWFRNSIYKKVY